MHITFVILSLFFLAGCGPDDPQYYAGLSGLSPADSCTVDGEPRFGFFASACGGNGNACVECGESSVCLNDTRECVSQVTFGNFGCYADHDCPIVECSAAVCAKSTEPGLALGSCVYKPNVVEGGGCIAFDGPEQVAGVCDDGFCRPMTDLF